jgi:hypothetical protein
MLKNQRLPHGFFKYSSIVQSQDKKSIQKVAALLSLAEILEQAKIRAEFNNCTQMEFVLTLIPSKNILPTRLIENHLKKFQDAFEVTISNATISASSTPRSSIPKVEVRVTSREKDMITSRVNSIRI